MSRFKHKILVVLLILVTLAFLSLIPLTVLAIRLPRQNFKTMRVFIVKPNAKIRLSYLHSVEHTQVEGIFYIDTNGKLRILETRMASVGTGLPNDVPERSHREKECLIVDEKRQAVNRLSFYIVPINKTHLYVDSREIPLSKLPAGTLIHIEAERIRFYTGLHGVSPA